MRTCFLEAYLLVGSSNLQQALANPELLSYPIRRYLGRQITKDLKTPHVNISEWWGKTTCDYSNFLWHFSHSLCLNTPSQFRSSVTNDFKINHIVNEYEIVCVRIYITYAPNGENKASLQRSATAVALWTLPLDLLFWNKPNWRLSIDVVFYASLRVYLRSNIIWEITCYLLCNNSCRNRCFVV